MATWIAHLMVESTLSLKTSVLLSRMDSADTTSTATPAVISRIRLLSRSRNGLGRLLRGTDQAMLSAFCTDCPSPRAP